MIKIKDKYSSFVNYVKQSIKSIFECGNNIITIGRGKNCDLALSDDNL